MTERAAASVLEKRCQNFETLTVGNGVFDVINNQWSTTDVTQCIQLYDDDSYGWEWTRNSTGSTSPNYPQVLLGTKPWGSDTGSSLFPVRRRSVDQFELELAVDQTIAGNEWNLAEEWWLTSSEPSGDVSDSITHEVMLVLDWGADHGHGDVIESNAVTDSYGNTIDYWANYQIGWDFHIFRIASDTIPNVVDFTAIMEYMSANIDSVTPDLWMSGVEVGNEYWDDTSGTTVFQQFDVTLNEEQATSGSNGGADSTAPTAPTNLTVTSETTTATLNWDESTDSGGSGLAGYSISVDGQRVIEVDSNTTQTTITELSAGTNYEFGVTAVDSAGNSSTAATVTQQTKNKQEPYNGPHLLPGRLQAEDFDVGGEGIAYHDTGSGNNGGAYRDTSVDIQSATHGGYNIGWIQEGEWWEYTVEVEEDGPTDLTARVASAMGGGAFHIEIDGQAVTDSVSFAGTGGWQSWTDAPAGEVELTSGKHLVRVIADESDWNLSWIDFRTPNDDSDSLLVTDYTAYPGENNLGNWAGAGSFTNGDGKVVNGALRLDYDGAGWYGEEIGRDITEYETLVLSISGAAGGEQQDFTVELGGTTQLFADIADGPITTDFTELRVDLVAAGVDRSNPGQLNLNFWQGETGTVDIEEIRFE